MPSPRVSAELLKVLDDKFSAHEQRSANAIHELKSELTSVVHDLDKRSDERHSQTLGVLSTHGSELRLHDLRITRVEEGEKERKAASDEWKRWGWGIIAALAVSVISSILTLLKH